VDVQKMVDRLYVVKPRKSNVVDLNESAESGDDEDEYETDETPEERKERILM
jgi:hypothetical protein